MKRLSMLLIAGLALISISLEGEEVDKAVPHKTGNFKCRFEEYSPLSEAKEFSKRFDSKVNPPAKRMYQIENELFHVYVPSDYKPWKPFGLFVWISSTNKGAITKNWIEACDSHKLIWVAGNKVGNEEDEIGRRMPITLDGLHNMKKLYNIDEERVYLGGRSGGGRVASEMVAPFADVIKGGFFVVGVNFWENIPTGEGTKFWGGTNKPDKKYLSLAKRHGRYVLLTGDKDFNLVNTQQTYKHGFSKVFKKKALYIQVPGMGHAQPPPKWCKEGLAFLDKHQEGKGTIYMGKARSAKSRGDYSSALTNYFLAGTRGEVEGFKESDKIAKALDDETTEGAKLIEEKDYYEAQKKLEKLVKKYSKLASEAAALLKSLKSDEKTKQEIKATGYLVKAKRYLNSNSRETRAKGERYLKDIVKKYSGTQAAIEANSLMAEKQPEGL